MVGLSIMGAAAPSMMTMSIAPFEAQKRAQNLGIAESAAVTYAAKNEGADTLSAWPNGCTVDSTNTPAHTISCSHGENAYEQTIERSFRTAVPLTGGNNTPSGRTFPYPPNPFGYTAHPCQGDFEMWGLSGPFRSWDSQSEAWTKESCIPLDAWSDDAWEKTNPDDWHFDLTGVYNRGQHPLY